jgi:hypothetical protein
MFITPTAGFILLAWMKKYNIRFIEALKLILPVFACVFILLSSYYFVLFSQADDSTKSYWSGRFTGEITSGIISSTYLYKLYQPLYGLHIYAILGLLGIISVASVSLIKVLKHKTKLVDPFSNIDILIWISMFGWFAFATIFMEVITKFPGTHIWTYIMPLCYFMGVFIYLLETLLPKVLKYFLYVAVLLLFGLLAYQSYVLFVDHTQEYPWEEAQILGQKINKPSTAYQVSLFGFPYYRNWIGIRDFIMQDNQSQYYTSNEKKSIPKYYLGKDRDNNNAGYIVIISKAQSGNNVILNKRAAHWVKYHDPIKIFSYDGRNISKVYLMPQDWKNELKSVTEPAD